MSVNLYPQGQGPIGVGVDGEGNIWAVNQITNNTTKIKPDGTIIGYYRVGSGPYTYSDMTGFNLKNITAHEGTWTVVHDSGEDNYTWNTINWHEIKPQGTDIKVRAKAANTPEELISGSYTDVQNGIAAGSLSGRFIQVEVKLTTSNSESPVLQDLAFGGYNSAPVAKAGEDITVPAAQSGSTKVMLNGTGSYDSDGDSLTYKWTWNGGQAEGPQPEVSLPEGDTEITLIVNDGTQDSQIDKVHVRVIGQNSFKTSIATDKPFYNSGETVQASVNAKNESTLSRNYKLKVEVIDENGTIVKVLAESQEVEIGSNEEKSYTYQWNCGSTLSGNYKVRSVWTQDSKAENSDYASFIIKPDGKVENTIATDKTEYKANEAVNISEAIKNLSTNIIERGLTVKTAIVNTSGSVLWTTENSISEILQVQRSDLKNSWNTAQNPAGDYTVVSKVYNGGTLISETSVQFKILSTQLSIQGVYGKLSVLNPNIYPGEPVNFKYSLTNTGNTDLSGLKTRLRIIAPDSGLILDSINNTDDLAIGASLMKTAEWKYGALKVGSYLVVYDAVLPNGKELALGSGHITVQDPYGVSVQQVVRPRVLAWAESQGNIDLAKKTLDGMQVFYRLVNNREDFMAELRTGKYNEYMMLDSKQPLTGDDDKELTAEIASGKGIIASRDANGNNVKNLGLFGAKFTGNTTPASFTVDFSADSVFGKLQLNGTGKAQNVQLDGGQQLAVLNSRKGTSPGVMINNCGKGKAMLITFDIGSCTGDTEGVLKKAVEITTPVNETSDAYTELEIKIKAYTAIGAEVKLNIPQGAELIWTSPEQSGWKFDTEKDKEYNFRAVIKLPQTAGQYPVTVNAFYNSYEGTYKFKTIETMVTRIQYPLDSEIDGGYVQ